MSDFVVISGCSGGGKSTLLAELARRGHAVVAEPGRRIVAEELGSGGTALPWVDPLAFARRAVAMSLADRRAMAGARGWVFFDRGLVDAAVALGHLTGDWVGADALCHVHRYNRLVFLAPPWPEIYGTDRERRHGLEEALAEYDRLLAGYPRLGYEVQVLPRTSVEARANLLLGRLQGVADGEAAGKIHLS